MKKAISLMLGLLCTIVLYSQTIHWITFIDTTDPNVGQIDVYGRQMLYGYFINEVNAALKQKGYNTDIQDFHGINVSPQKCREVIENLTIYNPNDIIVFYYIGHGGRPATDSDYMDLHPYPQMCLAAYDEDLFIPLEWIDKQLSLKGARLSVTMGMCCNNVSSDISIKEEPRFNPNYGPTYLSANKIERIQDLFLNETGHIIATSASPTQTSGCFQISISPFPNPANYRDRYSYAICSFFQTQLDKYNKTLTWDDFLTSISWFVDRYSNHEQTPFHDVYPQAVVSHPVIPPAPTKGNIDVIVKEQKPNTTNKQGSIDSSKWINAISNQLGTLIDLSLSDEARIEQEIRTSKFFADNAQVKFLAQESDQIIDKEDADVFLGRLSTTRLLLNIVVVEGEIDSNNKIKLLKVREIYKR